MGDLYSITLEEIFDFLAALGERLHPADNVVVAVRRLPAGTILPGNVTTSEPVPFGHKVAIAAIAPGEAVRKYGQVIGVATQPDGLHWKTG